MDLLQLKVTKITPVSNDAVLITLEDYTGKEIVYQPGQFLTFLIDFHGKELRRSYSICSTPGVDAELVILVKRVENGAISRYLIDHLQAGEILKALPPAGRFTVITNSSNSRTVFFLAAGIGISPIYSLLKKILFQEPSSKAILVYQNRDEDSIIFKDELELLQLKFGTRLIVIDLLSNPRNKEHLPRRLNNSLLEKLVGAYLNIDSPHDFFLCGPFGFMRMIQFVLKVMGVTEEHIRKENFVIEALPPTPFILDTATREVQIQWKENLFQFSVSYPETILHAALKHNIHLPYSCRAGRCASCTLVCVSGKVKMSVNEVLTAKDMDEGLVLTCVGYAETDLVLQL